MSNTIGKIIFFVLLGALIFFFVLLIKDANNAGNNKILLYKDVCPELNATYSNDGGNGIINSAICFRDNTDNTRTFYDIVKDKNGNYYLRSLK